MVLASFIGAMAVLVLVTAVSGGSSYYNNGVSSASSSAFVHNKQHKNNNVFQPSMRIFPSSKSRLYMASPPPKPKAKETVAEIDAQSEQLRKEIKELKAEAIQRLEALEQQLKASTSSSSSSTIQPTIDISEDKLLPAPAKKKRISNLLDETRWKISLSIGREPNTWMAKEWGESGQRINISFIAEFTPSQLYERDDFLRGGYSNAKILHIVDNEIRLGPAVNEGERTYKVKDGGWQISQGEGPMGTDLLRFYIEVDEEISHTGGDVSVPKGRVFCSCGYFPFLLKAESNVKEVYMNELKSLDEQISNLQKKKDETKNPIEGFKISQEIGKARRQAERVSEQMFNLSVTEPDKKLLRFTKDEDVGLTKEGGVCCRVQKGPITEYHILGRFSSACVDE